VLLRALPFLPPLGRAQEAELLIPFRGIFLLFYLVTYAALESMLKSHDRRSITSI
jgi:hypothetical protein